MQKLREIGQTGLKVRGIGFGGMPLSIDGRPEESDGLNVLKAAFEAGTNFIDTANVYCLDDRDIGHNESLIAKALQKFDQTDSVIVATKGGLRRPNGDWTTDAKPEFLRESCLRSLDALHTKTITLYQLHAPDPKVPFEDSVQELARLKEEGKIQHIGLSNVSLAQLKRAEKIVRIETVQNRCNPLYCPDYTNGLVDYCEGQGITYLPYCPVGGGYHHQELSQVEPFQALSQKYQTSPYCVILAWHLAKSPRVIPIPGASKIRSATDSPKALEVEMEARDIGKIDSIGRG